jgi:hypothetical protein
MSTIGSLVSVSSPPIEVPWPIAWGKAEALSWMKNVGPKKPNLW